MIDVASATSAMRSDIIGLLRFGVGSGAPKHDEPSEPEGREVAGEIDGVLAERGLLAVGGVVGAEPSRVRLGLS